MAKHGSAYKQKLKEVRSRVDCWNGNATKSQERKPETHCSAGTVNNAAIAIQNIDELLPATTSCFNAQRASSSGALSSLNNSNPRMKMPTVSTTSSSSVAIAKPNII